jgi:hypothetical protein
MQTLGITVSVNPLAVTIIVCNDGGCRPEGHEISDSGTLIQDCVEGKVTQCLSEKVDSSLAKAGSFLGYLSLYLCIF